MGKTETLNLLNHSSLHAALQRPGIIDTNFEGLLQGILDRQRTATKYHEIEIEKFNEATTKDASEIFARLVNMYDKFDARTISDYQKLTREYIDIVGMVIPIIASQPKIAASTNSTTPNLVAIYKDPGAWVFSFKIDDFTKHIKYAKLRIDDMRIAMGERRSNLVTLNRLLRTELNTMDPGRVTEFDGLKGVRWQSIKAQDDFLRELIEDGAGNNRLDSTWLNDLHLAGPNIRTSISTLPATNMAWVIVLELALLELAEVMLDLAKDEKDLLKATGSEVDSQLFGSLISLTTMIKQMDETFHPNHQQHPVHSKVMYVDNWINAYKTRLEAIRAARLYTADKDIEMKFARDYRRSETFE